MDVSSLTAKLFPFFIMLIVTFVASCGGGGTSTSENSDRESREPKEIQNIRFEYTGLPKLKVGDFFVNPIIECCSSYNDQRPAYSSSDPSIATVDQSGALKAVSQGKAIITALKPGDSKFQEATISYNVEVIDVVTANLLIGPENTLVTFPNATSQTSLYRSQDLACDFDNYLLCTLGSLDVGTFTEEFIDENTTLDQPGLYGIKAGNDIVKRTINPHPFTGRNRFRLMNFNDRLFAIAGLGYPFEPLNDVWTSIDGAHWTLQESVHRFTKRTNNNIAEHNGKLYLVAGKDASDNYLADVWESEDGINWYIVTEHAAFPARSHHNLISFKGRLWLFGGENESGILEDVWSSRNGIIWTKELDDIPLGKRINSEMVEFNSKLWIFGGESGIYDLTGTWNSEDGINWNYVGPWPEDDSKDFHMKGRRGFRALVFNNRIWLIAGNNRDRQSVVWSSVDGISWELITNKAAFMPRGHHEVTVFNDYMILAGGGSDHYAYRFDLFHRSDVWRSTDGVNWEEISKHQELPTNRNSHMLSLNNEIIIYSGKSKERYTSSEERFEIYRAKNGFNWTLENSWIECQEDKSDIEVTITKFKDHIYWIGGMCRPRGIETWSNILVSDDGIHWSGLPNIEHFHGTDRHETVVFNNKLWVIGGRVDYDRYTDNIWVSDSGTDWELITEDPGFSPRGDFQAVVFNNQIWFMGGYALLTPTQTGRPNNQPTYYGEIWSTSSGNIWFPHIGNDVFGPRSRHQVLELNGRLWLMGGYSDRGLLRDIWVSDNGYYWSLHSTQVPIVDRNIEDAIVHKGDLYIIGKDGELWTTKDMISWRELQTISVQKNN